MSSQQPSSSTAVMTRTPGAAPRPEPGSATDGLRMVITVVGTLMTLIAVVGVIVWLSAERDTTPTPAPASPATAPDVALAPAMPAPVVHGDVYFDFKSPRLRADQIPLLQEHVKLVHGDPSWKILLQGHADRHGPAAYNRVLAEQRADTVKRFLLDLGVPETSIRTTTIGPEGAVCDDPGVECQRLNRRVHIEMRRFTTTPTSVTPDAARLSPPVSVPAAEVATP